MMFSRVFFDIEQMPEFDSRLFYRAHRLNRCHFE
jgi:hypothetical protein